MFFASFVTHCTIFYALKPRETMKKTAKLSEITFFLCFLVFLPIHSGTKAKVIRYSGKLLGSYPQALPPYFEYEDKYTFQSKRIHCDKETTTSLEAKWNESKDLQVEGKASASAESGATLYCEGRPSVGTRFKVSGPSPSQASSKWIQGQVLEANPETGQIVYTSPYGKRGYLTVSKELAGVYHEKISRMEAAEIRGNFRYDRVRRHYVEEGGNL